MYLTTTDRAPAVFGRLAQEMLVGSWGSPAEGVVHGDLCLWEMRGSRDVQGPMEALGQKTEAHADPAYRLQQSLTPKSVN